MRLLLGVFLLLSVAASAQVNIIPQPVSIKYTQGTYTLPRDLVILEDSRAGNAGKFLNDYIDTYFPGYSKSTWKFVPNTTAKDPDDYPISLVIGHENKTKGYYELVVSKTGIKITGNEEGVFYGIQTLIQLLPAQRLNENDRIVIPLVKIIDSPRFQYRGMHLDVSRHFFPVSYIKKYIDYLALHKLNTFHWHLTDDQGWRIEIKKYPKLTSVGGWRNGTIIGRYPGTGNDGIHYGGFYTQDEVKEVVKYAADRYITVMPEIEMPGHASAAIAAYPELSCFPEKSTKSEYPKRCAWAGDTTGKQVQQTWGVFDDVFCAGKENTFNFLQDVLDEVIPLFPSQVIHVGGDECPKTHWKICPQCQKRMKDNNLKDEHELQSYFIQRMEKYLNSKGKTLMGWDEILEGGLAPNAMVMSWRGIEGGIAAAKQKHYVVMTPGNPLYFDHTESENEDSVTIGGYNPIEKVYAYEPLPKELTAAQQKYILGAQANLWCEYNKNTRKVEYQVFPRMSALSEILWSPKAQRNWKSFEKRLPTQMKRYDLWGANYSTEFMKMKASVVPAKNNTGVAYQIRSKAAHSLCEYCWIEAVEEFTYEKDLYVNDTIAQYDPNDITKITGYKVESKLHKAGETGVRSITSMRNDTLALIPITQTGKITYRQRYHHATDKWQEQDFFFNKATGKKITLARPASTKYPGDGPFTLVNGVQNTTGLKKAREFLGFDGTDCIATIDLGKSTEVTYVTAHFLDDRGAWIWYPSDINVITSNDGKSFLSPTGSHYTDNNEKITYKFRNPIKARYLKVTVKNLGTIPAGYPGEGSKPWLFVDEIEVK